MRKTLAGHKLSFLSVRAVATIDIKGSEPGLGGFVEKAGLPLITFSAHELNRVAGVTPAPAAWRATGARAVAEPAAILGAGGGGLVVEKQRIGNVTVAIAEGARRNAREKGPRGRERRYLYCRRRTGERRLSDAACVNRYPGIRRGCRLRPLSGPPERADHGQGVRDNRHDPRDRPLPEGHRPGRPGQESFRGQRRGPGHLRHGGTGAGAPQGRRRPSDAARSRSFPAYRPSTPVQRGSARL